MTKAQAIIDNIEGNGGLDMWNIRYCARIDNTSVYRYLYDYVKESFGCHGNTARKVAYYYL